MPAGAHVTVPVDGSVVVQTTRAEYGPGCGASTVSKPKACGTGEVVIVGAVGATLGGDDR